MNLRLEIQLWLTYIIISRAHTAKKDGTVAHDHHGRMWPTNTLLQLSVTVPDHFPYEPLYSCLCLDLMRPSDNSAKKILPLQGEAKFGHTNHSFWEINHSY